MNAVMKYQVESGVPVPDARSVTYIELYPFAQMKSGDSFFIANAKEKERANVRDSLNTWNKVSKFKGGRYRMVSRREGQGIRFWIFLGVPRLTTTATRTLLIRLARPLREGTDI
jgi:hypothetical protein